MKGGELEVNDPTEVRELLLKAKAELSKGWIQGTLYDEKGVCLFGSLVRGANLEPHIAREPGSVSGRRDGTVSYSIVNKSPVAQAIALLSETLGVPWMMMAIWNDDPERTDEEVVGLIDRALAKLPPAPDPEQAHHELAAVR